MTAPRSRARLGVLVPFTNTNLEPDMALMCPPDLALYTARMGGYDEDEIPDADQMRHLGETDLEEPLRLLSGVRPDVVFYGCTSATLTHGPAFDRALARQVSQRSKAQTVTAAGALVNALQALSVSRLGFASPYVPTINEMAVDFLSKSGFEVIARSEPDEPLDNEGQGALTPDAVFELGIGADHPEADALVLSCTDMRSVETIARLEAHVGKPVITSNQAMLYQALQLLRIDQPISGFGQLLERSRIKA